MNRRAALLAFAALGALGHSGSPTPTPTPAPSTPSPAGIPQWPALDETITIAGRYALAARNWNAPSYRTAWRRQLALATGPYRRELRAARPTRAQLAALRADNASSLAVATRIQRDRRVRLPAARVLVWLGERTSAAGQVLSGATRNEVRLRRRGGRWRVTGWTALPGDPAEAPQ
jgi:hypothetical protein